MKRSIEFEGVRIFYTMRGKGRPLILLHGYLEAGEVWEPLAERLEGEYRIITPDLPGHGESGVKGEVHTMEFLASAMREVLRDAVENRVLMVGHPWVDMLHLHSWRCTLSCCQDMYSFTLIHTLTHPRQLHAETGKLLSSGPEERTSCIRVISA